ncbi:MULTISPECIES: capsid cement protein [Bacteria]|uniref:DUF2190 domain-containing protein n=1 Tax=Microbacterium phage Min1 TaxID=446529 RepID=A6N1Z8_9CAUD|nr:head scaffolding protein [Microbacterium phage Min1]ABR10470.1 hypothetical protein [Microbacterium phage Min1]
MAADYVPKFIPGAAVTYTAEADIKAGRVVEVSGDRSVSTATADSTKSVGVAARDAKAGEKVLVHHLNGQVHRLVTAGAVAAGDRVAAAADGKVATATANTVGLALTSAAAADGVIEVLS